MSIQKKSLISTLRTTKKANAASSGPEASHKTSKTLASKTLASKTLASKTLASKTLASKIVRA